MATVEEPLNHFLADVYNDPQPAIFCKSLQGSRSSPTVSAGPTTFMEGLGTTYWDMAELCPSLTDRSGNFDFYFHHYLCMECKLGGFYKFKFGVVRGFLQRRFLNFIVEKDSLTFSEKKGKASIWKWVKICHIGGWPCSLNNTQRPHRGAKYFTEWWACVGLTSQSRLISHTVNRCGSLEYRFQD